MKYVVKKLKVDKYFSTGFNNELAKAGSKILICNCGEDEDLWGVVSWKEMTDEEVKEEYEQNECFYKENTVYTEKGNKVDIYVDEETQECFFKVTKLQGAN